MSSPFEDLPTEESMRILSHIHDLSVRSGELIEFIQNFQSRQIQISGVQLLQILEQSKELLKEQNATMVSLVERQLTLDDRLQEIVNNMENDSGV